MEIDDLKDLFVNYAYSRNIYITEISEENLTTSFPKIIYSGNQDYKKFIDTAKNLNINTIYLLLDKIESGNVENIPILEKYLGKSFVIYGFFVNDKVLNEFRVYADWAKDYLDSIFDESDEDDYEYEEDDSDSSSEYLSEEEKEKDARGVALSDNFKNYTKNQTTRELFIRKYFPQMHKKWDEQGILWELGNLAKAIYDTEINKK